MFDNSNLISINLVDKSTDKLIFDYPIIYYWNGEGSLEDMFHDTVFKQKIFERLTYKNVFTISIYLTYVFLNDEDEYEAVKKEWLLKDIIGVPEKFYDEILYDLMVYLYKCAFKVSEPQDNLTPALIFNKIQLKYPKKITREVVAKYIESTLSGDNYNLVKEDIDKIVNKFLNSI